MTLRILDLLKHEHSIKNLIKHPLKWYYLDKREGINLNWRISEVTNTLLMINN